MACVVGRSNIVGLPVALLLQNADATVTMVHSKTPNGEQICSQADIVIAACGRANMVDASWVKEGATVIDVGINAVDVRCSFPLPAPHLFLGGVLADRNSMQHRNHQSLAPAKCALCI